jgi:hypothetical protein
MYMEMTAEQPSAMFLSLSTPMVCSANGGTDQLFQGIVPIAIRTVGSKSGKMASEKQRAWSR